MGLQPRSPLSYGTPTTPTQMGCETPPTAPQPTTPPPVHQQEEMTPPNTRANQGSPTGINEINALASQLNISQTKDSEDPKSPSDAEGHSESPARTELDGARRDLFGSGAFDNLDDDGATTTDNEQNYDTVEFITDPQDPNKASGA